MRNTIVATKKNLHGLATTGEDKTFTEQKTRREDGSSTVTFAVMSTILVIVASFFISAGTVVAARAQLQAVADLAALAAADVSPVSAAVMGTPIPVCASALEVAKSNDAEVVSCFCEGFDVIVEVRRSGHTLRLPVSIGAKARAGPEEGALVLVGVQ